MMNTINEEEEVGEFFLTLEEQEKCKQAFDIFDKDGNGSIDSIELKNVLERIFQNSNPFIYILFCLLFYKF